MTAVTTFRRLFNTNSSRRLLSAGLCWLAKPLRGRLAPGFAIGGKPLRGRWRAWMAGGWLATNRWRVLAGIRAMGARDRRAVPSRGDFGAVVFVITFSYSRRPRPFGTRAALFGLWRALGVASLTDIMPNTALIPLCSRWSASSRLPLGAHL